jgi:hypothetical protein
MTFVLARLPVNVIAGSPHRHLANLPSRPQRLQIWRSRYPGRLRTIPRHQTGRDEVLSSDEFRPGRASQQQAGRGQTTGTKEDLT